MGNGDSAASAYRELSDDGLRELWQCGVMSTRWPSANAHAAVPAVEVLRFAAFASGPGGGNPAGVVLDASTLTDVAMQQIAADVGYAETAFVVGSDSETDDRTLRVRYFSPGTEVPFCGHATVATAIALAERRGVRTRSRSCRASAHAVGTPSLRPRRQLASPGGIRSTERQ